MRQHLPVHRFGVVLNVIWEISHLVFSYTLQPVHHQLEDKNRCEVAFL